MRPNSRFADSVHPLTNGKIHGTCRLPKHSIPPLPPNVGTTNQQQQQISKVIFFSSPRYREAEQPFSAPSLSAFSSCSPGCTCLSGAATATQSGIVFYATRSDEFPRLSRDVGTFGTLGDTSENETNIFWLCQQLNEKRETDGTKAGQRNEPNDHC